MKGDLSGTAKTNLMNRFLGVKEGVVQDTTFITADPGHKNKGEMNPKGAGRNP